MSFFFNQTAPVSSEPQMPFVEVTEVSDECVQFVLSGADTSIANALRRTMIGDVPTLAIDLITVLENTSNFHDEFLCHRLGLIPIDSRKVDSFLYRQDCSCADQCNKCTIQYTLDVTCTTDETYTVTHRDIHASGISSGSNTPMPIKIYDEEGEEEGITIAKLRNNQRIHFKMIAFKGNGRIHAKWIPVATAYYKLESVIKLDYAMLNFLSDEAKKKIVASCPVDSVAYEVDKQTGIGTIVVKDKNNFINYDEYENKAEELGCKGLISLEYDETMFHFTVESTGALPASKIVEMALDFLLNKIASFDRHATHAVKKSKSKEVTDMVGLE